MNPTKQQKHEKRLKKYHFLITFITVPDGRVENEHYEREHIADYAQCRADACGHECHLTLCLVEERLASDAMRGQGTTAITEVRHDIVL